MFNRINIIIPVLGSSSWTGGFTYQSNLIEALRTRPDVSVFLVRNLDQSPDEKTKLKLPAKVIHFISQVRDVLSNKFSLLLRGYNKQLTHKLNRYTIAEMNVLFTHNNAHLLSKTIFLNSIGFRIFNTST